MIYYRNKAEVDYKQEYIDNWHITDNTGSDFTVEPLSGSLTPMADMIEAKYKDRPRKISFNAAFTIARCLQRENRDWLLCGSLALMVANVIRRGFVSDIDFVSNTFPRREINKGAMTSHYNKAGNYYHYEIRHNVDLFIHNKKVFSDPRLFLTGVRLQNLADVIFWKNQYNRKKDQEDLSQIDHLPDILFEI